MKPLRIPFSSWSPDTAPFYAEGENTAQNCMPYQAAPNYSQSLALSLSAIGNINGSNYIANAAKFDGSTTYLNSPGLTSIANSKKGTFSAWVRLDSNSAQTIFAIGSGPKFQFSFNGSKFTFSAQNSSNVTIFSMSTVATYSSGATWYNVLGSWDLNTATANLFVNNVSDKTVATNTNDTINYADVSVNTFVGRANAGGFFSGALAELWFDPTVTIDFTSAPNRALFISAGFPVSLGSTGQTPTGSSPLVYLKSAAGQNGTNSGTGGNFTARGVFAIASSSPSDSTPTQYSGATSFIDSTGLPHTYAGTSNKLVEITATTANNVSKSGGYTNNGSWEFAAFTAAGTNNVYATDYTDAIQVMAIGGTVFADLGGGAPKAKHIAQIGQFVVVGNTNGGVIGGITQGAVPNRVWWPQIGNPANWPDPLTLTASGDQSSFEDLPLVYGGVQHISNGELYGLVFQEHGITNFTYIGGNDVFQVNTYEKQRGCLCVNGCVQIGDEVYFRDESGFFVTNGAEVKPIGHDLVDKTWLADVNTAYLDHVRGAHDADNKCIWWTYPSLTATLLGGFVVCDKVIVYNYANSRWAMGYVGQSLDILFSSYTLGYTMEQMDSVNSNLDLIMPSLDSPFWNGGQPIVGAFGIQQIGTSGAYASYAGTFTGSALTAIIDTKEVNLNPGGLAQISNVNPVVMGATLANVQMAPITRNTLSDAPVVGTLVSPSARTGKVPMRATARYHRVRAQISGGFTNAMGVEPEFTGAGDA